jgi:hypothetical protein
MNATEDPPVIRLERGVSGYDQKPSTWLRQKPAATEPGGDTVGKARKPKLTEEQLEARREYQREYYRKQRAKEGAQVGAAAPVKPGGSKRSGPGARELVIQELEQERDALTQTIEMLRRRL